MQDTLNKVEILYTKLHSTEQHCAQLRRDLHESEEPHLRIMCNTHNHVADMGNQT